MEKHRVPKAYRLEALDDELRRFRIRHEARLMAEARAAGVVVPILYDVNLVENKMIMEFIDGPTAKDVLDQGGPAAAEVARAMGQIVGRLHRAGIIHGDLATSNMIIRNGRIVMIDFSLGGKEGGVEARVGQLHLLKEARGSANAPAGSYERAAVWAYGET